MMVKFLLKDVTLLDRRGLKAFKIHVKVYEQKKNSVMWYMYHIEYDYTHI
jgi:hypothetical protein